MIKLIKITLLCGFVMTYLVLYSNCGKKSDQEPEAILARIGDKTISLDEFIRRAEYTVRPNYCKGSTNIDKKIVLNSLIAEKMLALEAGEDNELARNERFQRYIQGRKEQAMRQWLYHEQIYQKVKLPPDEINKVYRVAGRKYKVQYFTLPGDSLAAEVDDRLHQIGMSFEQVYQQLSGSDEIPEKEIEFKGQDNDVIHAALFSDTLQVNQVLGPLQVGEDDFMVMKIKGWTDRVVITENDTRQRYEEVVDRLTTKAAVGLFETYAGNIMKGKKIEFVRDTFFDLVNVFGPVYLNLEQAKKNTFMKNMLDKKDSTDTAFLAELGKTLDEKKDEPLFRLDGETWTVGDFEEELQLHPLVFRKREMKNSEFAEQFKLAIVDMIQDRYITKEAYKKGYDKVSAVKQNENMWRDSMLALYQKYEYLKQLNITEETGLNIITEHLNPYIDELQKKYSNVIEVAVEHFNSTNLTRIDLFAIQQNVPFPILVPSFPQVTTDHMLDYGKKMEQGN